MRRNVARSGQPDAFAMLGYVAQCAAQMSQPMGLADDVRMQRNSHHQSVARALRQHLIEMVDDHPREGGSFYLPADDHRNIIDLLRIRQREDGPASRAHDDRLIVHAPIEQIGVAGLGEEIRRDGAFRNPRPEPTCWRGALAPRNRGGRLGDQRPLGGFVERALLFGIAAAVADEFIAPRPKRLGESGRAFIDIGVDKHAGRESKFVEKIDQPPSADAVAIIAPGVVQNVRLRAAGRKLGAVPLTERKVLEIDGDINGEACSVRPVVPRPAADRRIFVAAVALDHALARSDAR
jgi:hypothetical protein